MEKITPLIFQRKTPPEEVLKYIVFAFPHYLVLYIPLCADIEDLPEIKFS